jgi:DNA-directed RNA polymerase subunit K/omega
MSDAERPGSRPQGEPWWTSPGEPPGPPTNDEPALPEDAGQGGQSSRPEWFDRREPILGAVAARVEPVERLARRIAEEVQATRTELAALSTETRDALKGISEAVEAGRAEASSAAGSTSDLLGSASDQLGGLEAGLEAMLKEALSRFEATLATAARAERLDEARRALEEAVAGNRAALGASLEQVRSELRQSLDGLESGFQGTVAGLLEALDGTETTMRASVEQARRDLLAATSAEAVSVRREHATTTERSTKAVTAAVKTLEEGLRRVEDLGSAIEAMAEKRAFRELVESEQALREEQRGFVERLARTGSSVEASAGDLATRIDRLEERIGSAVRTAGQLEEVPGRVSEQLTGAVDRAHQQLTEGLGARFGEEVESALDRLRSQLERGVPVETTLRELRALAGAQSEVARTQQQLDELVTGLRAEVRALQDRIEGWGRARSAPHLASDIEAVTERVERVERLLDGELADRIAAECTARVMAGLEERDRQRRGLFRR